MPASTRDLLLRFQADTTDLKAATTTAKKNVSGMATNVESSSKKAGGGFRKGIGSMVGAVSKLAGPIAAVFAVDKIKDFAVETVNMASDLNETMSKSSVIFGKQAGAMEKWAEGGAQAFGLSKESALGAAASFGDMFQQIGFTGKESANASKNVVQMAADLGSFNNLETGDVLDRISAAMRGEYDSLQAVIPNINAARVEKEALAATGKKNAKALTAEEKAQATLAIIQKDGARAQGDFARTSDGLANQQKILKAQFDNVKASLGQALLPVLTKGAKVLNKLLGPASENAGKAIEKIGQAVQGTWDLVVNHDFTSAFAQAFNVEEDAPIVGFLIDLNEAFTGTGKKATGMSRAFDAIKKSFTAVGEAFKKLWSVIGPIIQQIGGKIFAQIKKNLPEIQAMFAELVSALATWFQFIAAVYSKIASVIKKVWSVIGPTVLKILGNIIDAVVGILSGLIKVISGILNVIVGIFTGDFSRIKKGVGQILNGLVKIVKSVLMMMYRNTKAIFEPMIKWVINKILGLKKKITNLLQSVLTWVKTTWKAGWSKLKTWITSPIIWAAGKVASWIAKIKKTFTTIKTWASTTWKAAWKKIRSWITDPVKKGREDTAAAIDKVKDKFKGIKTWASTTWKKGWSNLKGWILDPITKAKKAISGMFGDGGTVRKVFTNFVTATGTIFAKMKKAIGKPINAVISFINKGFIRGGINKILGALGVPKKEQVPWITPVSYRTGGPIFGPGTGTSDSVLMRGSKGEHVWTAAEVRKFGGHRKMLAWRKAVEQGKAYDMPPGFAAGGVVRPVPGGFGTFPSYPGHTGVDFPVGRGTPIHAVMAGVIKQVRALTYSYGRHVIQGLPNGMEALYAHMRDYIVKAGQSVGAGQVIGYVNSTGRSSGDHLHFTLQHPGGNYINPTSFLNSGTLPGGTAGGGITGAITDMLGFLKGLSPVKWLTNKAKDLQSGIIKLIGAHPWAQGLARLPGMLISKAGKYLQDTLFGGMFGGGEPAGSGSGRWRSTIVAALKANGLPTSDDYVSAWLRQVESESGGNPKAVQNGYVDVNTISGDLAKGLLQTISATFNAYKHPGHGDIFNGFDNALAAINYAKSRYGSRGMLGVIGHGHGYDSGGFLPAKSATLAINNTNRPEPVLTGQQWDAITATPQPHTLNVHFHGVIDSSTAAREIEQLLTRRSRISSGVVLPARTRANR